MSSPWDDADNVTVLKRLHAEGKSSREIAHALGCWAMVQSGRNAVISKIHRLGLSNGKRSKIHRERKRQQHAPERRRAAPPPKPPEKPIQPHTVPEAPEPRRGPVAFVERRNGECVWPLWDGPGEPRECCGAPRVTGSSYCAAHRKVSISPRQPGSRTKPTGSRP